MRTIKQLLLLSIFLFGKKTFAQSDFPAFGSFNTTELNIKECSFDPEAEAIVLLDKAVVNYDDEYNMITDRRVRIKILKDRGLDRANIVIPFYSKGDFEYISRIEAYTHNFSSTEAQLPIPLDKNSIYKEKVNAYYSRMKFAMPAVKVGSIIEYHYISTMKSYGGLDEWIFQSDIPTLNSNFLLHVLPRAEFAYTVQKKRDYPINIKPMPGQGMVYYEMKDIPALRFEPYMDAQRDYLQKVMFQLSGFVNRFGSKQDMNTTWRSMAYDFMTDRIFGSQLDKDLKIDEIKKIKESSGSATEKLNAVYSYIKTNYTWNGIESKYAIDGLKPVADRKKGTSGELNLLLVNLLTTVGIEAYPILAAERDFGKIDTTYPFADKFNKTVAFAIADNKQYILDASVDNAPPDLTPFQLLGTTAFLVDKKKFNLIHISPGNKFYKNIVSIEGSIDKTGLITAEAEVKSYDYARQLRMESVKKDRRRFIRDNFENALEGITIDSFLVTLPENDTTPFRQVVRFKQQLNESGGFIFVNPNLFTGLEKNPFTSNIRFTNVNFGFPYQETFIEKFKLPPGSKIDVPEDKVVQSNDNKIQAIRQVQFENGELTVAIRFTQIITLVKYEDYFQLKDFYKKMVDILNEPIVVKLAN